MSCDISRKFTDTVELESAYSADTGRGIKMLWVVKDEWKKNNPQDALTTEVEYQIGYTTIELKYSWWANAEHDHDNRTWEDLEEIPDSVEAEELHIIWNWPYITEQPQKGLTNLTIWEKDTSDIMERKKAKPKELHMWDQLQTIAEDRFTMKGAKERLNKWYHENFWYILEPEWIYQDGTQD